MQHETQDAEDYSNQQWSEDDLRKFSESDLSRYAEEGASDAH